MRVIAGRFRGRRLVAPRGADVRPTYDRVRESLFGTLGERIVDSSVLDLFAGAGSLGIESLSRGARHATFVDRDRRALDAVRRNLSELGVEGESAVVRGDALRALGGGLPGAPFDVVFVDPPYASGLAEAVLERLGESCVLAQDALVVVERGDATKLHEAYGGLVLVRTRRYGSTEVDFFETARSERAEREAT